MMKLPELYAQDTTIRDAMRSRREGAFLQPLPHAEERAETDPMSIEMEIDAGGAFSAPESVPELSPAPKPVIAEIPKIPEIVGEKTTPIYVPGHFIRCTDAYRHPPYHTSGWYQAEADFTWIAGYEAAIEMVLRRPAKSYTLSLDVIPNGVGERTQSIEIFFNFYRIGFYEVPRPMLLTVELPSEIFTLRKTRIALHCRNAVRGSDHGVNDSRLLGIALRSWQIA